MSSYSDLVLLDRPIAYWPLNDAGPTYADLGPSDVTLWAVGTVTAHAYAGPLSGASSAGFGGSPESSGPYTYAGYLVGNGDPGDFGSWAVLDASDNIASASVPYVNLRGPLTLEAWLYPVADEDVPSTQAWFGWGDPDDDGTAAFGSGISSLYDFDTSTDELRHRSYQYNTWSSPNGKRTTAGAVNTALRSNWVHVVQTVDAGGAGTLYINGRRQGLLVNDTWIFTFPPGNSADASPYQETVWITLGCCTLAGTTWPSTGGVVTPSDGWVRQWKGGLAHVAWYSYALTSCQVKSHYTVATGDTPPAHSSGLSYNDLVLCDGPDAYWPLDGAGSTPYVDLSPNHNDLVETQRSALTPPPPPLTLQSTGPISGQGSVAFNGTTWLECFPTTGILGTVDTSGTYQTVGGNGVFCSFTMEAWATLPDPQDYGNPPTWDYILNLMQDDTSSIYGGQVGLHLLLTCGGGYAAGHADVWCERSGGSACNLSHPAESWGNDVAPFGAWHHIVAVHEWSNSLHYAGETGDHTHDQPDRYTLGTKIYIDGVWLWSYSSNYRSIDPETWPGNTYFSFFLGVDVARLGAGHGDGYGYAPLVVPYILPSGAALAAVAQYGYALSDCQVQAHYACGTTGSYTPCSPYCMSEQCGRRPVRQIHAIS